MPSEERLSQSDTVVYIDRSDVLEGTFEELKAGIRELVGFVETHEPQLIAYGFYVDEQAGQMTVVAVHPDSASLEFHIDVAGSGFSKLADLIKLRAIEVYGRLSDRALELLQQKAAMLGDDGSVVVHERYAGFSRLPSATT
ncbi:MAG TPA: hypothetical protein VEO00_01205 [Actinomycetota bacterium]|nr:hypothetical protein [Actinomycetota bacterium]